MEQRNAVQHKVAQNELFRSVYSMVTSDEMIQSMFVGRTELGEVVLQKLRSNEFESVGEFQQELDGMLREILQGTEIPSNIRDIITLAYQKCGYDARGIRLPSAPIIQTTSNIVFKYEQNSQVPKAREIDGKWISQVHFGGQALAIGTYDDKDTANCAYSDFLKGVGDTKDGLNAVIERSVKKTEENKGSIQKIMNDATDCMKKTCDEQHEIGLPGFTNEKPIDVLATIDPPESEIGTPNRPGRRGRKRRSTFTRTKRARSSTPLGTCQNDDIRVPRRPVLMCSHVKGQELTVVGPLQHRPLGVAKDGRILHYDTQELMSPLKFCKVAGCRRKQPYLSTYIMPLKMSLDAHIQVCNELDTQGNLKGKSGGENIFGGPMITRVKRRLNGSPRSTASSSGRTSRRTNREIFEVKQEQKPSRPKLEEWREKLQENDVLDARDSEGKWWEAKILGINKWKDQTPRRLFIQYVVGQPLPNPEQGAWFNVRSEDLERKGIYQVKEAFGVCCECSMCGVEDEMRCCEESNCHVTIHTSCGDVKKKWLCEDHVRRGRVRK